MRFNQTKQRTLKRAIHVSGIGLHSGLPTEVTIKPAGEDQGIVFTRIDLPNASRISALLSNVTHTELATTLGRGEQRIGTIEHLMAALQGTGITNALIEVRGPEVPILDGSAQIFCEQIKKAGIKEQVRVRPLAVVTRRVEVKVAEKWAVVEPSQNFQIDASIEWDHPAIGFQEFRYTWSKTSFHEICAARTFGFLRDIEALHRNGYARGGSLDNAVVLNEAMVINPDGLRYPNEFVRHKVLDALGDFALAGLTIQGHFRLHRSGHELHRQILDAIFSNPRNYEIVQDQETEQSSDVSWRMALASRIIASAV